MRLQQLFVPCKSDKQRREGVSEKSMNKLSLTSIREKGETLMVSNMNGKLSIGISNIFTEDSTYYVHLSTKKAKILYKVLEKLWK